MAFSDADKNDLDGAKTYKVALPPNIPQGKFWSFTLYDNQTRSMLETPQRYPRAGSQGKAWRPSEIRVMPRNQRRAGARALRGGDRRRGCGRRSGQAAR